MGLIAREIESRGIPTVTLTSAWSITQRVNPPRAVFVDFPLGHTAGKPNDAGLQRSILRDALAALVQTTRPGTITPLAYTWSEDDSWKDRAMRPQATGPGRAQAARDDRVERHADPQYQHPEDRVLAETNQRCPGCMWLED